MSRKEILSDLESTLSKAREHLATLEPEGKTIYVFGAGATAGLSLNAWAHENIKVAAYLDNYKAGGKFNNFDIIKPDDVPDKDNAFVLIYSPQQSVNEFATKQLTALGIPSIHVDTYIFATHTDEILQCAAALDDDESVSVYSTMIKLRMDIEKILPLGHWAPFCAEQYFAILPVWEARVPEVFVDCGAFVGDTTEHYVCKRYGGFNKIFAFEPEAKNFRALSARRRRLLEEWALDDDQIILVNAGVGRRSESKFIRPDRSGSVVTDSPGEGNNKIELVSLDEYFADQQIDFLKADIESYELDMLKGAENVIRRDRPKLAICIYHNASDMFRIQQWLANLNLGYKFAVRHHSVDWSETVLYAWQ